MKMKYTERMSNKLNVLLTKNYDAAAGYKKAAKIVENPQLKRFFETQAQNRFNFGHVLTSEISNMSGSPIKGTSISEDVHRAWMTIKDTFTSTDEEIMLAEVIRGEKKAIEEFYDVISDAALPPSTKSVIIKQVTNIEDALRATKNFEVIYS